MCEGQKSGAYNNRSISMGKSGDPYGIRTRVAGVKGQCPRPLDEGVAYNTLNVCLLKDKEESNSN